MLTNQIVPNNKKAYIDDLEELEKRYNFNFPNDLKSFYLQYNGGRPKRTRVTLQVGDWKSNTRLNKIYALYELEKKLKDIYEDWWIEEFIPFASDEGGDDFCFSTRDFDYGCIYFFMSDCLDDENPENALIKVGENFTQFINNMD